MRKPAKAADLGGDCCADLEERVAELEATTVRKDNKKVSVQLYGKVNYAVMYWDDGGEQNTYVVDNYNELHAPASKATPRSPTTGLRATGWSGNTGGCVVGVNQFDDNNANDDPITVRWSQMYLDSKAYGTLNWGLTATPKYDITKNAMEYISTVKGEGGAFRILSSPISA